MRVRGTIISKRRDGAREEENLRRGYSRGIVKKNEEEEEEAKRNCGAKG